MTRLLFFILSLLAGSLLQSQELVNSRTTSEYTYIYSITEKQALKLLQKGSGMKDDNLFKRVIDSFPTGTNYAGRLQPGNYLEAYIDQDKVKTLFITVPNVHPAVIDNKTDLVIQLRDTTGRIIENAVVRKGAHTIPWDPSLRAHILTKSNSRGIITVTHEGITTPFRLERSYDNSFFHRSKRKLIDETPVKYIWVPVSAVVMFPYKAVSHARTWGVSGSVQHAWQNARQKIKWLFKPFPSHSEGFMLFNKPSYMPGDTVMIKAFVVKGKRDKPVQKEADLSIHLTNPGRKVTLAALKPYTPGGYAHSFVLSDTLGLRLDTRYRLSLTPSGRSEELINGSFAYEYYDLRSLKLTVRRPDSVQYRGRPFVLGLKALNENEMILPDARVTLHLLRDRVMEISHPSLPVKDTLAVIRETLSPFGETLILIPDTLFPAANMSCRIVAVANTADNESVTETVKMSFIDNKEEIRYTTSGDTINLRLQINGMESTGEAQLTATDAFGNSRPVQQITLPGQVKIDPFVSSWSIVSGKADLSIKTADLPQVIIPRTMRTADSLFISITSNTGLPFTYFIYDLNREVRRGTSVNLEFRERVTANRKWFLSLSYLWGGVINNKSYEISRDKGRLNIFAEQPDKVIPGSEASITLTVTDIDGRPVSNTDITAFSLTRKFNYDLPQLPRLAGTVKNREHINSFRTFSASRIHFEYPMHYDQWSARAGLDTIEYFKFRYHPEEVTAFISDMGDGITQFAPFIFRDGVPVAINQVWVDHRPVYIDFASAGQPYSFRVDSGYHFVSLRTSKARYDIDHVHFLPGRKLILSIRDSDKPADYKKEKARAKMSTADQRHIAGYVMPYRVPSGNSVAYLQQGKNLIPMNDLYVPQSGYSSYWHLYNRSMAGPVMPSDIRFVQYGKYTTDFRFEPRFEYEFQKGLIKMTSFDPAKKLPRNYSVNSYLQDWRSRVLTPQTLDSLIREREREKIITALSRSYREGTVPGNGDARLISNLSENSARPLLNLMVPYTGGTSWIRPGNDSYFSNVLPGWYRFVTQLSDWQFMIIDSVEVRGSSTTYIDLSRAGISDDPEVNRIISEIFTLPSTVRDPAILTEQQQLQAFLYQNVITYDGPGYSVQGIVTALSDGEEIPGVAITSTGNGFGTVSSADGSYLIRLPYGNHHLNFSFVGMKPFETEVYNECQLDVSLEEDFLNLEEVVVTAYGLSGKSSLFSSYATVDALQGAVAGIPASDAAGLRIRGVSSADAPAPLILIDGVPWGGDMNLIDPELIRAATIIKDPAVTALYGSRAAGGIIMLTMKPGGVLAAAPESEPARDEQFLDEAMAAGTLRRNFRDYGYWKPDLRTDDSGRVTFTVKFPDDVTSWETFAVAINGNRQAGSAKGNIRAYLPVTGMLSTPFYVVEGDSLNLIGRIMNHTGTPMMITGRFISNSDTLLVRESELTESIIDTIPLTAGQADSLRLEYSFTTGAGLREGEYRPLPVLKAGIEVDSGMIAFIEKDSSLTVDLSRWSGEVNLTAVAGLSDIRRTAGHRLMRYLYGCNEQIASRLAGYLSAIETDPLPGKVSRSDEREIRNLISKLLNNRNEERLWGWWGRSETEEWVSLHIIKTLLRASKMGYTVNLGTSGITDYAVLTLEKNPLPATTLTLLEILTDLGAKADFNRYLGIISDADSLHLTDSIRIAALKLRHGMTADISFLEKARLETHLGGVWFTGRSDGLNITRTDLHTTLLAYDLLSTDTLQKIAAPELVRRYFYEYLSMGGPLNSYQTASVLNALSIHPEKESKKEGWAKMIIAGRQERVIDSFPQKLILQGENRTVTIRNAGELPLFLSLASRQFITVPGEDSSSFHISTRMLSSGDAISVDGASIPVTTRRPPADRIPASVSSGKVNTGTPLVSPGREAKTLTPAASRSGEPDTGISGAHAPEINSTTPAPPSSAKVKSGVPITLVTTVKFFKSAEYVVVEIPVPSGFAYNGKKGFYPGEVHREFYRDHVAIFLRHTVPGTRTFEIELMPRFTGHFIMNPAKVSLMYFPVISSNNEIKRITIN